MLCLSTIPKKISNSRTGNKSKFHREVDVKSTLALQDVLIPCRWRSDSDLWAGIQARHMKSIQLCSSSPESIMLQGQINLLQEESWGNELIQTDAGWEMRFSYCSYFKLQLTSDSVVTKMHSDVTSFLALSDTPWGSSNITRTNSGRWGAVNLLWVLSFLAD